LLNRKKGKEIKNTIIYFYFTLYIANIANVKQVWSFYFIRCFEGFIYQPLMLMLFFLTIEGFYKRID